MAISKPTSRDIAHAAGVSQATVSRALRNSPLVRPETRERILEIARSLNYRVDRNAAGLRTRQSRTLALLLFEDATSDASHINPFFLAMLGGIARAAAAIDYDLLTSFQQLDDQWHARYEGSHRADGIILLGYGDYVRYGETLQTLTDAGAHFIIWGPMLEGHAAHSLGCDNRTGGRLAGEHLLGLGRQRIAFLGGTDARCPEFALRHAGLADAMRAAGVALDPARQVDADNSEIDGAAAARRLLERGVDFDAVFAASDLIAIGAARALEAAGGDVPGEVSVVGFDDIPAASYVSPALTTVRQDTARASELLVRNLVKIIEGEPVESTLLAPSLVVRESCGHARR